MFIKLKSGAMLNLHWLQDCFQGKHNKNIVIFYLVNGVKLIEDYETEQEVLDRIEEVQKQMESAGKGGGLVQKDSFKDFDYPGNPGSVYLAKDTGETYYWDENTESYVKVGTAGRTGIYQSNEDLNPQVGGTTEIPKDKLDEVLKPTVDYSEGSEVIGPNSVHGVIVSDNGDSVTVKTTVDLGTDSFIQVTDETQLPQTGHPYSLYYLQDKKEFRVWNGTDYEKPEDKDTNVQQYDTETSLPQTGEKDKLYYLQDVNEFRIWDGTKYVTPGGKDTNVQQCDTENSLPQVGEEDKLYWLQDIKDFRIWDADSQKYVKPAHPIVFNDVPVADAELETLYIVDDTIKYTKDNVNWIIIQGGVKPTKTEYDTITFDGTGDTFDIPTNVQGKDFVVTINGLTQHKGIDYTVDETTNKIKFDTIYDTYDKCVILYQKQI